MSNESENKPARRVDDKRAEVPLNWSEASQAPTVATAAQIPTDVMIDIETLGTTPGSAILSIGAVVFGPEGLGDTFYAPVRLTSCVAAGLTIDPNTIEWWMRQSDEARKAAFQDDADALVDVLGQFTCWFDLVGGVRPWCHGATFDVPLLDAAYQVCGMPTPWKFYNVRDTRTLYDLAGVKVDRSNGTHHNALDDAKAQAEAAVEALRILSDRQAIAAPVPPLTAPAPLTEPREINLPPLGVRATVDALIKKHLVAPAPQQSEGLSDERIAAIWNSIDGKAVIAGENQLNWNSALRRAFAKRIEREVLAKAAPAAPVQTAEPKRIPDMLTVETIQGAIAFGRMGINPPPSPDHWGNEFWQIGRQLAKLGETSAWDNVTPVDVAAPVQAEQAQAEPIYQVKSLIHSEFWHDTDWHSYEWNKENKQEVRIVYSAPVAALPAQAAAVRAAEWISVEDRMPEDTQQVLIFCPDLEPGMRPALWMVGSQTFESAENGWVAWDEVTHWMPLPAAPSTATRNDTGALGEKGAE